MSPNGDIGKMKANYKKAITKIQTVIIAVVLIVAGVAGSAIYYYYSAAPVSEELIKIGITAPLTGPLASSGKEGQEAILIAVDEWNAKGGIYVNEYNRKLKIKVFIEDNEGKPENAVANLEMLITREKIHIGVVSYGSSIAMACMELASKYGIPIVSFDAASSSLPRKFMSDPYKYRYYFKMCINATGEVVALVDALNWLTEKTFWQPKTKTVAIIAAEGAWGREADIGADLLKNAGWDVVALEYVQSGVTDFYSFLTKVQAQRPALVYVRFFEVPQGASFIKQFHEVGCNSLVIFCLCPSYADFVPSAGRENVEGLIWESLDFDPLFPAHAAFAQKVTQRFNTPTGAGHLWCYDPFNALMSCIEKAQSVGADAITQSLLALEYEGLLGLLKIQPATHEVMCDSQHLPRVTAQFQNGVSKAFFPESRATTTYVPQPWAYW
jgi:branched-chain amino acid transport system substrate-binding protein